MGGIVQAADWTEILTQLGAPGKHCVLNFFIMIFTNRYICMYAAPYKHGFQWGTAGPNSLYCSGCSFASRNETARYRALLSRHGR